jgi:selenocysteine lyase/cysteine desulfurase
MRECLLHEDAMRFQGGIPNLVGVVGALSALELIEQVGIDFIQDRVSGLVGYAMEKLEALDLDLRTPFSPDQRAGLVFFKIQGARNLYKALQSAGIYCGCFMGGIRIDPNFYNTYEEIDQFAAVVKKFKTSGLKNQN